MAYLKGGLANRLRVLASASILAKCTGRTLYASWVPSRECNVQWEELFLNPLESCPLPLSNFHVGINLYDDSVIPRSWYGNVPQLSVCKESDLVAVHTCRNFQPQEMTYEAYQNAKSRFYRKLRPVDTIEKTVDDMQKQYFDGHNVIGVHIRRNDHLAFLKKDHRLVCPTGLFVEAMEHTLRVNPESKFFLATDDKKEENLIRRLFPDAVIVYEKDRVIRNTTEGMQDALVDWMLLSKTTRIIASYASSFSEEAGIVNRIKTDVILRKEELSKPHFKKRLREYLKANYTVLKEEGIKQFFLHSYNYRKRQIFGRRGENPSRPAKDT